ncbi:hypothetical protein BOX15_Mlig018198g1 [Macrostomum lignano]|uniref:Transporter n=1 Tax=Macrostomum lignano TaxID=282301 RepID=A0A267H8U0_9PLAT|nr:hypothetical protein BOX15_Mlig018198g1 [Macrostomum lignano]
MPKKYVLNTDSSNNNKFPNSHATAEPEPPASVFTISDGEVAGYHINQDPFPLASIELQTANSSEGADDDDDSEDDEEEEEEEEKSTWNGRFEFVLSVLGYNIGLGNLLRFPYLCIKNGGGAFLLPYFLFLILLAVPLYVLEMSVAQYSGMTPIRLFGNIAPIFKGIGWSNVITCFVLNIYYSVVIGWILFYLVNSFYVPLLWSSCKNQWKDANCFEVNRTAPRPEYVTNCSEYQLFDRARKTVTETFYEKYMLDISSGVEQWGGIRWQIFVTLLAAWIIIYLCVFRGIHSFGKVVYLTVLFPYVALTTLLIRGVLLPGSREGILYYLTPDWPRLATLTPWIDAAQQIFWSLGPTWGALIMLASHNRFSNNIYRDAIVTPIVCSMTAFLGGFAIFAYLGNMAWKLNTGIDCIFKSGPTMAFIVYPDAVLNLPFPQIWSVIFFILLLTLAVDSEFCTFETMYQCLADEFRILKRRQWLSKLIMTIVSLLLGLPMTTNAAHYIYQLMDWYHVTLLSFVALVEVICFAYVYGSQRIRKDVEVMTGIKMTKAWDFYWRIPLLAILAGLLIMTLVSHKAPTYGNYQYPPGAIVFGWVLAATVVIPLPVFAIHSLLQQAYCPPVKYNSKTEAMRTLVTQTEEWHIRIRINSDGLVK